MRSRKVRTKVLSAFLLIRNDYSCAPILAEMGHCGARQVTVHWAIDAPER